MTRHWLITLLLILVWGCGEEATTPDKKEESKVVEDDPASSTSPETSQSETPATQPSDDTDKTPKHCSTDGKLCLVVSLTEDQGLQVKAVIKPNNAQGSVVFSLATTYEGDIEGFFDADGQYHDLPEDTSGAEISVAITNGEAVLYDTEMSHSEFSANVDDSFVLKARYETSSVEMKACQITDTISCSS